MGRAVLAFLGAAFGVISVMLIGVCGGPLFLPTAAGPTITPALSLYQFIGYNLLIAAAILALRVLFTILRSR